jgi:hypothetical protein
MSLADEQAGRSTMADNLVRLGLALSVIMLITACLYQFGSRASGAYDSNISIHVAR